MEEGKRQKQVAAVLQEELNDIFRKSGLHMMGGGMVSISSVKITPDLLEARIYLSLFQVPDMDAVMKTIEDRAWDIKKQLTAKIKHQMRRMPVLHFYRDDTLDQVFKMEELFRHLNEEKKEGNEQ